MQEERNPQSFKYVDMTFLHGKTIMWHSIKVMERRDEETRGGNNKAI
jgi:hypothetical protein